MWSPLLMASHPCSWAAVGAAKAAWNQARATGEKRSNDAIRIQGTTGVRHSPSGG